MRVAKVIHWTGLLFSSVAGISLRAQAHVHIEGGSWLFIAPIYTRARGNLLSPYLRSDRSVAERTLAPISAQVPSLEVSVRFTQASPAFPGVFYNFSTTMGRVFGAANEGCYNMRPLVHTGGLFWTKQLRSGKLQWAQRYELLVQYVHMQRYPTFLFLPCIGVTPIPEEIWAFGIGWSNLFNWQINTRISLTLHIRTALYVAGKNVYHYPFQMHILPGIRYFVGKELSGNNPTDENSRVKPLQN